MKVLEQQITPPGGWRYTQKETGMAFQANSFSQLLARVAAHRRGNGLDVAAGWQARFEEDLCQQMSLGGTTWCGEAEAAPSSDSMTVADVRRFLKSMRKIVAARGQGVFVDQATADSRALICESCPKNRKVRMCAGCDGVRKLIDEIRGSRTTAHDSELKQCAVCKCDNKVKVWLDLGVVDNSGLEFPGHCWAKAH